MMASLFDIQEWIFFSLKYKKFRCFQKNDRDDDDEIDKDLEKG